MNQKQTIAFIGFFGSFLLIPILLHQVAAGCIDRVDAGPSWMKGYTDAQRDFHGKGFDVSTHLEIDVVKSRPDCNTNQI